MNACCNWCLAQIKAPENYNSIINRCYCSQDCLEKDWLFNRWMSNERLTELAERARDEQSNKQ